MVFGLLGFSFFQKEMQLKALKTTFLKNMPATEIGEGEALFFRLLEDKYDIKRLQYLMDASLELAKAQLFEKDLKSLKSGVPVQHITGFEWFKGLKISVNSAVLVPRPETELLIDLALKARPTAKRAIDLGTGSGCIALALKTGVEKVYGIDKSILALDVARENARNNHLEVEFREGDLLGDSSTWPNEMDLILSNPPYVRRLEKKEMDLRVFNHEPEMALFVPDKDPLVFYRAIAGYAHQALKADGLLGLEINQYLALETKNLIVSFFEEVEVIEDQFGHPRFILAHKKRPTKK
jgi:release factor glutamine methyltransferase